MREPADFPAIVRHTNGHSFARVWRDMAGVPSLLALRLQDAQQWACCVQWGKSVTNRKALSLCCIGLPLIGATALADEVRFDGQNVMQGELKRLDRGELYFKTPGTGTISIEWNHVDEVSSSKNLEIEFDNGDILYGVIEPTDSQGQVSIRHADGTDLVAMSSVIRLTEIEDRIRDRFDGTASAGVNLTKANNFESYNLGLDMTYTTKRYVSSLDSSSNINSSDDTPKTEQSSLKISSSRKWKKRR